MKTLDLSLPKRKQPTTIEEFRKEQSDILRFKSNLTFACWLMLVPTAIVIFLFGIFNTLFTGLYALPENFFTTLLTYLSYIFFFTPALINIMFYLKIITKGVFLNLNQIFFWLSFIVSDFTFRFEITKHKENVFMKILKIVARIFVAIILFFFNLFFSFVIAIIMKKISRKLLISDFELPFTI